MRGCTLPGVMYSFHNFPSDRMGNRLSALMIKGDLKGADPA